MEKREEFTQKKVIAELLRKETCTVSFGTIVEFTGILISDENIKISVGKEKIEVCSEGESCIFPIDKLKSFYLTSYHDDHDEINIRTKNIQLEFQLKKVEKEKEV